MNDSHLLQYPIRSLMSSAARREQLTQDLPAAGVAKGILTQGQRRLEAWMSELEGFSRGHDMTDRETETQRNKKLAQEYQDQEGKSILGHQDIPNSEHTYFFLTSCHVKSFVGSLSFPYRL